MARDLPFDGEDEVAERGGDTAYRIASGAARVARGGAYVTGGALIAANGGGTPAPPGELDSRNAGWAHNVDPHPDVPSPVVTFPDPEPVAPEDMPFGSPGDASVTMPLPHGTLDIQVGGPDDFEDVPFAPRSMDEVPGLSLVPGGPEGSAPGSGFGPGTGVPDPGFPGVPEFGPPGQGIPGLDGLPGLGAEGTGPEGGFPFPDAGDFPVPGTEGFGVPGGFELPAPGDAFRTDIFDLSGFDPNAAGQPQTVAQTMDSDAGGAGSGLPDFLGGVHPAGASGSAEQADADWFEYSLDLHTGGMAGFALGGAGGSVTVDSDLSIDIALGPDGFRTDSDWDFGITTQDGFSLDDQLDQYLDWAQTGGAIDAGSGAAPDPANPAADLDGAPQRADSVVPAGGSGGPGTGLASGQSMAAAPGAAGVAAAPGVPAPMATGPAPAAPAMASAPAMAPAPMAPVAPAPALAVPVPPPVAPAAVAPAVQPVAATPLQTTVQPEVATTPVAHVFQPPAGQSPLTAPAAQLPDLFHRLPQPGKTEPQPPAEPELPGQSTIVLPTTTAPVTTSDGATTTPDTTTTGPGGSTTTGPGGSTTTGPDGATTTGPGAGTTTPEGSTTAPTDGTTTPDGSTSTSELTETDGSSPTSSTGEPSTGTEGGSTTGESGGVTTTAPGSSTGDTGGTTTEPIGGDTATGGPTSGATPSTVDVPTQQVPTADQPVTPVPTVSVPTQPTVPDAQLPSVPNPLPTPLPAPQVKPVADHGAVVVPYDGSGFAAAPYTDHTVLGFAGGGLTGDLSAGLLPHTAAVAEDSVADPAFWVYF